MYVSVFVPVPCCLDDYRFVIHLKVQGCDGSHFGFLFQDCFGYSGSFLVPYKLEDCSSSVKNAGVILIGIALNMEIALGSIDILTIFVLPIQEHGIFFHFLCRLQFLSSAFYSFQCIDFSPLWLDLFLGI